MGRRYKIWIPADLAILDQMYGKSPKYLIMASLPGRTWTQIGDAAHRRGLTLPKPGRLSRDEVLRRKREDMARRRADPSKREQMNKRNRDRYRNSEEVRRRARQQVLLFRARHFFSYRSNCLRGADVSAKELWSLWKSQRGRCALTGRKLDRNAHLDHKVAKSRGGKSTLDNLQWLCPEANYLKRHLSHDEFLKLCRDIVAWVDCGVPLTDDPVLRRAFPNPADSNAARWKGRRIGEQVEMFQREVRR